MPPGFQATGTEPGIGSRNAPAFGISRMRVTSAQDFAVIGKSHRASLAIRSTASRGVEMFSFPLTLSSGRIILRCSFVCAAPRSAIVFVTCSMPSRSIRMLVAVLSDRTIIGIARSCSDISEPASEYVLKKAAPARPIDATNRQSIGQAQFAAVGPAQELEEDRDLDGAALRKHEPVVDAKPLAGGEIDDGNADDARRGIRRVLEIPLKFPGELFPLGILRAHDASAQRDHKAGADQKCSRKAAHAAQSLASLIPNRLSRIPESLSRIPIPNP